MAPDDPDRRYDDGTDEIPDFPESRSSEAWHPIMLLTDEEIPNRNLD
jgi:hypothetical protein